MAELMQVLEDYAVLSADLGVSSRKKRKFTKWRCLECKEQVRVDAVQGWSVGCLRSDVLSYQIKSKEERLKLVAAKKDDATSVPEVIAVHTECIARVAFEACKQLLTLHAPDQADRLKPSAAVPVEAISSAVDSDDESMGTERESRVSWKCPTECSISLPRGAQRTIAPWLPVNADCRLPVSVPESQPPPECYRCSCRNAPLAACSM